MGPRTHGWEVKDGLRRGLFALIGILVTAAALALAFFRIQRSPDGGVAGWTVVPRFDLGSWFAALPSHAIWWVPFLMLQAALPALRAPIWGFTIPPPVPPLAVRYHALAIGALVHNTMPARLGLLATAWFAARSTGRQAVELLSSLLVAKLLELAALVTAIAATAPLVRTAVPGAQAAASPLGRTALVGFAAVAGLGLVLVALARLAPWLATRLRGRGRWPRVVRLLDAVAAGLRGVGSLRRLALGLACAFAPVAAAGLGFGLALDHAGAASGIAGGWLLLGALTLGQITPGLPVGAGVYMFVCSWGARSLGASDAAAASIAVLAQLGAVLGNLGVGAVSAALHRRELGEILRWRRGRGGQSGEEPPSGAEAPAR
jgi:glycosyltransferase 2 family protein